MPFGGLAGFFAPVQLEAAAFYRADLYVASHRETA